jgi:hypothetical protein
MQLSPHPLEAPSDHSPPNCVMIKPIRGAVNVNHVHPRVTQDASSHPAPALGGPHTAQSGDGAPSRYEVPVQVPRQPRHGHFIFWPLYTGTAIPIDSWRSRMWLDTWV